MREGLIRNHNQVKQAIDFKGLDYGNIHPSDIDAVLEFDNEHLILIEVKRIGNDIPEGQKRLLERICNDWNGNSIVLKGEHKCNDTETVFLDECILTESYKPNKKGVWTKHGSTTTIKEVIDSIAVKWNIQKLLRHMKL